MDSKVINVILALLIFLPTCIYIPIEFYFLLIGLTVYLNRTFIKEYLLSLFKFKVIDKNFSFLILFSFIALLFRLIDYQNWESIRGIYSFAYLFPFTYIIARSVNKEVLKYIVYLLVIESAVSILQYILGVNTFFKFLAPIFYSYLRESIGSRFAARYDGIIPETTPTIILSRTADIDKPRGSVDGNILLMK